MFYSLACAQFHFPMLRALDLLGGEAAIDGVEHGQTCLLNRRNGVIDRETGVRLQDVGAFLGEFHV